MAEFSGSITLIDASNISTSEKQHFWFNPTATQDFSAGAYITSTKAEDYQDPTKTSYYKKGSYLLATSNGLEIGQDTTIAASISSAGLRVQKGGVKGGTAGQSGFVYLSTDPYGNYTINSSSQNDWKEIIGTKFGVRSDGTLYASGANISGVVNITGSGSNVYTTDDVNPLEIGGRNLLLDSESMASWYAGSRSTISGGIATITGSSEDWEAYINTEKYDALLYNGDSYIFSFEYNSTVACNVLIVIAGSAKQLSEHSWGRSKYGYWGSILTLPSSSGKWVKHTMSARSISLSNLTQGSGDVVSGYLQIYNRTDNGVLQVKHLKFEKGNKATDWSPAPEDAVSAIDAVSSASISETVSVYYRSTTHSSPSISSSTSIGTATNTDNAWEYIMPVPKRDRYFYTCEKYVYGDGSISFSTVRELQSETYASKWVSASDSTYIDGGRLYANSVTADQIAANSIGAKHITISDSTNLATVNEMYESSLPPYEQPTAIENGYLIKKVATQTYLMVCDYTPNNFKTNDELYYEFYGKAATAGSVALMAWGYTGTPPIHTIAASNNSASISLTTTETLISGTIKLSHGSWDSATQYLLGFSDGRTTKSQIYIRKLIIRRKNGGELIVDGSITASKMSANSITISNMDPSTVSQVSNANIEVGGRNLLLWSDDLSHDNVIRAYSSSTFTKTNQTVSEWSTDNAVRVAGTGGTSDVVCLIYGGQSLVAKNPMTQVIGTDYSASIYIKNHSSTESISIRPNASGTGSELITLAPNEAKKLTWSWAAERESYIQFNVSTESVGDAFDFSVWHPMWVEGTKATDWTPAPEDVDSAISDVNATATAAYNRKSAYTGIGSRTDGTLSSTISGFSLATGAVVSIYFGSSCNYAGALTLNVSSTGAKPVWVGDLVTSDTNRLMWHWGTTLTFGYDGTNWRLLDTPPTYYGTSCSTAASTAAKATTIPSGMIFKGTVLEVPMTNANTATSPSLSINNTASSASALTGSILYGTGSTAPTQANGFSWLAGMSVIFKYDGKFWRTGNQTVIDGANILTGTINADRIKANVIDAVNGGTGKINADKINVGQINIGDLSGDIGGTNLYGRGSDLQTTLVGLNNPSNGFSITTEDGVKCAHATGALTTTKCLSSKLPYTPRPMETFTFSGFVKIKNIVRGTTNPMCEVYFGGATIDGTWRGWSVEATYLDGVKTASRSIGFESFVTDTKWHHFAVVAHFNYSGTSTIPTLTPSVYLRDCTGDLYVHHIKLERGNKATDWSPAETTSTYVTEIDGDGIFISLANQSPTTSAAGNSVKINGSGLYIYKDGVEKFYCDASNVAIGTNGGDRTVMSSNGMDVYKVINSSQIKVANFSSTITLGRTDVNNKSYIYITDSAFYIKYRVNSSTTRNLMTLDTNGLIINNTSGELMASFGSTAQIGQIANGKSRVEIKDSGVDFYNRKNGTDIVLAHIGYTSGPAYSGTDTAPYYDFGIRKSGSTKGNYSFIGGIQTEASKYCSHAEGYFTKASGLASHAQNYYTVASYESQTAIGRYNSCTSSDYAFMIGNGSSNTPSNAFYVKWDGYVYTAKDIVTTTASNIITADTANATITSASYARRGNIAQIQIVWTNKKAINVPASGNIEDFVVGDIASDKKPIIKTGAWSIGDNAGAAWYYINTDGTLMICACEGTGTARTIAAGSTFWACTTYLVG